MQNDILDELRRYFQDNQEQLSSFIAALWSRAGRQLREEDLEWTTGLGLPNSKQLVFNALKSTGAIIAGYLNAEGLSSFTASLVSSTNSSSLWDRDVLFTLPVEHPFAPHIGQTLLSRIKSMILEADRSVTILVPFIELNGFGLIQQEIRSALFRGVNVTIITHDINNIASTNSRSLETIRRDAINLPGVLEVYSAVSPSDAPRDDNPLLHGKLIIIDSFRAIVSSANVTSYAFKTNFEVGVEINGESASVINEVVKELLNTSLIVEAYRNHES